MNPIIKGREFWHDSAPLRRRFGTLTGVRIHSGRWRHNRLPKGQPYETRVPGLATPVALRAGTSDRSPFEDILGKEEWEIPVRGTPAWMIDAGANIGMASLAFSRRFPAAKVVAIEPDRENFELLRYNLRAYPNVHCLHGALWSHTGTVSIADPTAEKWALQVVEAGACDVPAHTIPSVLDRFGIDEVGLLKIDIEGAELEVFGGDTAWLDQVRTLAVEPHDRFRPGCTAAIESALHGRSVERVRCGEYKVFHFT